MLDKPIIDSLLEEDFYIFPMNYLGKKKLKKVTAVFRLINRNVAVKLAELIDAGELREHLDHFMQLRFRKQEIHYIGGTFEYDRMMFDCDYLNSLHDFQLCEYDLQVKDGQFILEFCGEWDQAASWETPALAIINELYVRALMKHMSDGEKQAVWNGARQRLSEKVARIKKHPGINFSNFGFRRRAASWWQREVDEYLLEHLPGQYRGTSNTLIAKDLGVMPMGTNAHSIAMLYQGYYHDFDESANPNVMLPSQMRLLIDWYETFGPGMSLFLPDTYDSDYFFSRLPPHMLVEWKGSRQDSGVPAEYIQKMINRYRHVCVDPKAKLVVPSDGLVTDDIIALDQKFGHLIKLSFGWGTNLTFDLPGLMAISLVCKLYSVNGVLVAKLSDNRNKSTGHPDAVARVRRQTSYDVQFAAAPRY